VRITPFPDDSSKVSVVVFVDAEAPVNISKNRRRNIF
tara:strand:- start:166 stop:276 length:111 start_codon:yes stop_codon:yes gene_type:complete